MSAGRRVTACNLCSAAPRAGWFQTAPRPGTAGRENSYGDFLTDTAQSTGWESSRIQANIPSGRGSASGSPSGWQNPWQRGGHFRWSRKAHGPEATRCYTPSPGAPGSSSPEDRSNPKGLEPISMGQTTVYLVLRLLQVPTRPEGQAKAVADFGFIFSASQLLCQPQSWEGARVREG